MRYFIGVWLLIVLAALGAGWRGAPAQAAPPAQALPQVQIEPSSIHVRDGVTLTLRFTNAPALVDWQWVDPAGRPATWQGRPLPFAPLQPIAQTWTGMAGAPPQPGTYRIRLSVRPPGGGTAQSLDLPTTVTVQADAAPVHRGLVWVRARNLWIYTPDGTQRAVTYYDSPAGADAPAWSPDGRTIAFIHDPGDLSAETQLWLIRPDGSEPRRVATPEAGNRFAGPAWAADGTLYVAESRPLTVGGVDLDATWTLMRVDPATGRRTPVIAGAEQAAFDPTGPRVVFVRTEFTSDGDIQRALVAGDLASGREAVLVPGSLGAGLYAPAWAPDGRTIVFAGQGLAPVARGHAGLAAPTFHGGTWDLWTVPAAGGQPRLLSAVQEDLPVPHWTADGRWVWFISPTGFWQVPAGGGPPVQIGAQTTHTGWSLFAPQPRPAAPLAGTQQCFPATGQCLRGLFLRYWQTHGGLTQLGYPIGAELQEEGRVVQYTERARLEWHPENAGTPYEVLLGRLGADLAGARAAAGEAPFARHSADPAGRFFPETGQTLAAPFRAYWERQGGLPVFGYPLSAAFREVSPTDGKPYLVQYFERNRLEYHPEYAGTPSEILLGLLGVQEWQRRYQD